MTLAIIPEWALSFLIVFARVGTLIMLMPGVGERFVPARLRLAFALLLALMLMPIVRLKFPDFTPQTPPSNILGVMFNEILIGLIVGFCVRIIVSALQTAGTVIAQEMGLSSAITLDPSAGVQNPAIGNLLTMLGMTLVFVLDLHHLVISAIYDSYTLLPPMLFPDPLDTMKLAITSIRTSFILMVKLSAPFIFFGVLFNLGLGILSRMMPQLQIFFVGMPAAILIGMVVLMSTLGTVMAVYSDTLRTFIFQFIQR